MWGLLLLMLPKEAGYGHPFCLSITVNLVRTNSVQLLNRFQGNVVESFSITSRCAYPGHVMVRWFFFGLLPFDIILYLVLSMWILRNYWPYFKEISSELSVSRVDVLIPSMLWSDDFSWKYGSLILALINHVYLVCPNSQQLLDEFQQNSVEFGIKSRCMALV